MPNYRWLANQQIDADVVQTRMRTLRRLGDPYTDEDIADAPDALEGKTELDALVAYLQGLGVRNRPPAQSAPATTTTATTPTTP
jgi:cytochrome c oxidase cbb3-type subunit 2